MKTYNARVYKQEDKNYPEKFDSVQSISVIDGHLFIYTPDNSYLDAIRIVAVFVPGSWSAVIVDEPMKVD